MGQIRLDQLLVQRGLVESREKAQRLIMAGQVRVGGHPAAKPGNRVADDAEVSVAQPERFVGRGGEKLEAAFVHFGLDVREMVCLDVGASTGGFTDCLLQHGAARVFAVDVGRAQLHPRVAGDPRVTVLDGINARHLDRSHLPGTPDFACADVSFISLTKILPALVRVVRPGAQLVTLIKPQFEAGREQVPGGVVRDPEVRQAVVDAIHAFGEAHAGLVWLGVVPSPLKGPEGNVEFLAHWKKP